VSPEAVYERVRSQRKSNHRAMRFSEIAYQAVKDSILSGILRPEYPLVEERLAEVLEISRTPLREALAMLMHEGLIEAIPYKGLFVKTITIDEFIRMYRASEVIETAIARAAAQGAKLSDIEAMEQALTEAERCLPDDGPGALGACRLFMQHLGESAGNPYLTQFLMSIEEKIDVYLIMSYAVIPEEKLRGAINDRRTILSWVRAGDASAAEQAAQAHAQAVRTRWRELLERK